MANDTAITPESIIRIGTGFMAAKHLFVASDIGLFAALAERPLTLAELAAALGIPTRTARISADACVSLGLVHREGERYANAREAQAFLSGRGPMDLRPWARFWNRISYPAWQGLEGALRGGARTSVHTNRRPKKRRSSPREWRASRGARQTRRGTTSLWSRTWCTTSDRRRTKPSCATSDAQSRRAAARGAAERRHRRSRVAVAATKHAQPRAQLG